MKLKKFVIIPICLALILLFYVRELMVELIKAYLVPICISIIGGISLKVISWLFKRVKAGISKPMKVVLQKDCENFKGKGYILCGHCGGTGNVEKEVAYSGMCKVCNGSGLVKTTCPTCFGNKAISKSLRFQIISSESKVDGILFWPRTQTISIKVRNLDEKAGYFWAYVNLKDPSELSKKSEGIYIKPCLLYTSPSPRD